VRNRILLKNIAYAGVLAALIDVDLEVISGLLSESYGKKPKLLDSNTKALRLGYDYVKRASDIAAAAASRSTWTRTRGHNHDRRPTRPQGLGCVYAGGDGRCLVPHHSLDPR